MNDNIIHYDIGAGILICREIDDTVKKMNELGGYPIIMVSGTTSTRFKPFKTMPKHPWQHKIIMDSFEKIGWPVKVTTNGKYYSLKNKKDRFRFKLKYGK